MKSTTIIKKISVFVLIFSAFSGIRAFAMTPTLSLTSSGQGSVSLSVYGDPNSSVTLEYSSGYGYQTTGIIGYTNGAGYYSSTLNTNSYAISPGQPVYALVDNIQSPSTVWPYASSYYGYGSNTYGYGTLSLSQTSLTLEQGQSQTISAYNESGTLYVSSDSNSLVATGTIYGNEITVNPLSYGSTTLLICSNNGGCASLYVTVTYSNNYNYSNGYGYPTTCNCTTSSISLSQNSLTLSQGQSQSIQIYGNNNGYNAYNTYPYTTTSDYGDSYYIYSFTNPGTISPSISGNTLTVSGTNSGSGTVTVCPANSTSAYGSNCATVYVTVSGYNNYYPYTYDTYY